MIKSTRRILAEKIAKQKGIQVKSAMRYLQRIDAPVGKQRIKKPRLETFSKYVQRAIKQTRRVDVTDTKPRFTKLKRERVKALKKKRYKHTYALYSDFKKIISLSQAIRIVEKFFDFLQRAHNPVPRNVFGLVFMGIDDSFGIQPRYWRDRDDVLSELRNMLEKYKSKIQLNFMLGWIEQAN